MTDIFESAPDKDGDFIDVTSPLEPTGDLVFSVYRAERQVWNSSYVTRAEVIKLYDALGRWLGEDPTPEQSRATAPPAPPAYATEDRVRAMIAEAVLPLYESPQATVPDPDPHDVGHPDPAPEVMCTRVQPLQGVHPATRCTWCGFLWTDHPTFAEQLQKVGEAAAKVMAPYKQLLGCECGHGWGVHSPDRCSAVHRPLGGALHQCTCTRTPPKAQP